MSNELNIVVSPGVAAQVRAGDRNDHQSAEVWRFVDANQLELRPLHPGENDPDAIKYFVAQTPPAMTASEARALGERFCQTCRAVEAAYVKPADELP